MFGRKASILAESLNPLNRLRGSNKPPSLRKNGEEETEEESTHTSTGGGPYEREKSSRNGSFVFFGRRHSAVEEAGLFRLSASELAFLPLEVRRRLGKTVGHLPPAPCVFKSRGTVLFVDVSGFTKLGMELAREHGTRRGAQLLAEEITQVLAKLTEICLEHGGDVSKYAGDALLCVFDSGNRHSDEETVFNRAKQCAIAQLLMMKSNAKRLDIHGGLCHGSILHFHLGSADDRLRWYLMAGEAMAGAANLVDVACPGEILCSGDEDDYKFGVSFRTQRMSLHGGSMYRMTADSEQLSSEPLSILPTALSANSPQHKSSASSGKNLTPLLSPGGGGMGSTRRVSLNGSLPLGPGPSPPSGGTHMRKGTNPLQAKNTFFSNTEGRGTLLSERNEAFLSRAQSDLREFRANTLISHHSEENGQPAPLITILTAQTPRLENASSGLLPLEAVVDDDSTLRAGLPRSCNVYIPAALRAKGAMEDVMPEMKSNVSIVFVEMEDMVLTEDELMRESISDEKLDLLNSSFVKMTRIAHAFGGEVRDMLFDDKGCVFIAVFGAHHVDHELSYLERLKESQNNNTPGAGAGGGLKSAKSRLNLLASVTSESSEFRAVKAAMAITTIVDSAHVGVSSGSCFVGMCGTAKRHDFIVIGHEVNVAARLMTQAGRGEVLVSEDVYEACKDQTSIMAFTERKVQMQKREAQESTLVYAADVALARQQESFLAQFRYDLFDSDLFVGRSEELASVEQSLDKMCLGPSGSSGGASTSGCIVIDANLGIGKSAFVSRVRKMGKGRISICYSRCRDFAPEFGPWRAVLESLTGLRPDMRVEEMKERLLNFDRKSGLSKMRIDIASLARILPFVGDAFGIDAEEEEDVLLPRDGKSTVDLDYYLSNEFKQIIAKVGKAVGTLLVMGNAESRKAGARGTLVILENLEKSDMPSLLLLEYLIDHLESTKRLALCITVLSRRATPLSTATELDNKIADYVYSVVDKATHAKCKLRLNLMGLKEEDAALLVARFLGHAASRDVLQTLYRITKGSPMHLTNVLQYCREHSIIARPGGGNHGEFQFVPERRDQLLTTYAQEMSTVEGVLRMRFDQGLDEEAKDLLRIAANIRGEFDAIFLQQAYAEIFNKTLATQDILTKLRLARKLGFLAVYVEDKTSAEEAHAWGLKHDTIANVICSTVPAEDVARWEPLMREAFRALELRLQLGFYGRVDDFDLV